MSSEHIRERARDCLICGAVGDAWGGPYEGRPPTSAPNFPRNAAVSDDTQLTLATCEAIASARGNAQAEPIAQCFRKWFEDGRFTGLGSSTLKALRDLSVGAHWALSGARGEFAAGAGAAMRAAPLAFVLDPAISGQRLAIRDICRITHHNDEAYAGALAIVVALRHCVGADRVPSDLLRHVLDYVPDTAVRDRLEQLAEFTGTPEAAAARFGNTGHVVDAVPLALYIASAVAPTTAEHAIRAAVSIGGDTDTIAALTGQITGAAGGLAPLELWRRLPDCDVLQASIERFVLLL